MQAIEYKIGLIGHTNTGKTSFIRQLLYGINGNNNKPTIGVDVYPYDVRFKDKKYRLNFWDCAGDENNIGLGKNYLLDSDFIFIFKDNNKNNKIFENWVPKNTLYTYISYNENSPNNIQTILKILKNNLFNKYGKL